MRRWSVGGNNYWFTSKIFLDTAPWYIFAIEYIIQIICDYFPRIPFPKIKIKRDGEETDLRSWYGTTQDLFHIHICTPISNWCFSKTKLETLSFPYNMLKELFPESFIDESIWDSEEDMIEIEKNKKYSNKLEIEFKKVYKKLDLSSKEDEEEFNESEK